VVASGSSRPSPTRPCGRVSIPFIAGQWSLLSWVRFLESRGIAFQSPSLRGSGRFSTRWNRRCRGGGAFQSPSLRGSGRFPPKTVYLEWDRSVSIPFIAGQWSLQTVQRSPAS